MLHIGAVATIVHGDRFFILGMHAQILERPGTTLAALTLFGEHRDSPIEADCQNFAGFGQRGIDRAVLHIWTEAAETGLNDHAIFGMRADISRQGEQRKGQLQIDFVEGKTIGKRGAFGFGGFLAFAFRFAQLDIETIGTLAEGDFFVGLGIRAQHFRAIGEFGGFIIAAIHRKLARVFAFWIAGAAHEGTMAAQSQSQPAFLAGRADAGVGAVFAGREEMRSEFLIQGIEHGADSKFSRAFDGRREVPPEIAQDGLPVDPAAGDVVETIFHLGGEVVFHIALEIAAQETDHEATLIFRDKPFAIELDVFAILQDLDD